MFRKSKRTEKPATIEAKIRKSLKNTSILKRNGKTCNELAKELGVKQSSVSATLSRMSDIIAHGANRRDPDSGRYNLSYCMGGK